jgi:hypothetical protein
MFPVREEVARRIGWDMIMLLRWHDWTTAEREAKGKRRKAPNEMEDMSATLNERSQMSELSETDGGWTSTSKEAFFRPDRRRRRARLKERRVEMLDESTCLRTTTSSLPSHQGRYTVVVYPSSPETRPQSSIPVNQQQPARASCFLPGPFSPYVDHTRARPFVSIEHTPLYNQT